MIVVPDTSTVISGLLWMGLPKCLIQLAEQNKVVLFTSGRLLEELKDVLGRPKFEKRIRLMQTSVSELIHRYLSIVKLVDVTKRVQVIADDPGDDEVISCAINAQAEVIISGDHHLLNQGSYLGVRIMSTREFFEVFGDQLDVRTF